MYHIRLYHLVAALTIGSQLSAFSQEYTFNVSVGADFPELLNLGLRYEWSKYQFGVAYGSGIGEENIQTLTTDFWYHCLGHHEGEGRQPGYVRTALEYLRSESDARITKDIYAGIRIGREFLFNDRTGIRADIGFSFLAGSRSIMKPSGSVYELIEESFNIIPAFGLAVFYKF